MISDAEAILCGLILLVLFGFVIINLWLSTLIHDPTAGQISHRDLFIGVCRSRGLTAYYTANLVSLN